MATFRVLIVDDHSLVRRGLRAILESEPGVEVCAEVANGRDAIAAAIDQMPDLALVDLTMPGGLDGFDVTQAIRKVCPSTAVLILTMHFDEVMARRAVALGARGYVLKSDTDPHLLEAVRNLRNDKAFFSPEIANLVLDRYTIKAKNQEKLRLSDTGSALSPREVEVLARVARGQSTKGIASDLNVSVRTIDTHRHRIMHKMSFRNTSELVLYAVRNLLIEA
jgi:DNA-binding NarL/FixJ family response regulator